MWGKKKWIIISVLAAVALLAAGIIGGAAYAASGTSTPNTTQQSLAARVATILGIDQTKVGAAFTQAQKDMQDEALTSQLKSLVDEGKITQAQADAYKAWMLAKPAMPDGSGLDGGMGLPGGPHGMLGPGATPPATSPNTTTK